jgi:hypothetical protein
MAKTDITKTLKKELKKACKNITKQIAGWINKQINIPLLSEKMEQAIFEKAVYWVVFKVLPDLLKSKKVKEKLTPEEIKRLDGLKQEIKKEIIHEKMLDKMRRRVL